MNKNIKKILPLFAIAALSMTSAQASIIIGLDLGSNESLASADFGGVIPSANWAHRAGAPIFSNAALILNDGSACDAKATLSIASGNDSTRVAITEDLNTKMFYRGVQIGSTLGAGFGGPTVLTVDSLDPVDFATYDVYAYFAPSTIGGGNIKLQFNIDSTTYYTNLNRSVSNYTGTFVPVTSTDIASPSSGGNYVKFSGLTGSSFTFNAANITNSSGAFVNFTGLQIVAVPEPSTIALCFGLAVMGLAIIRRRK